MIARKTILFSAMLALVTSLTPAQFTTSPVFSPPEMVQLEIGFLQFMGGGGSLTPAEQEQAKQIVMNGLNDHPDRARAIAAQQWQAKQTAEKGAIWDSSRYNYTFRAPEPAYKAQHDTERRIIDAHDPVIGLDPERHLLFTEHMLPRLRAASQWVAGQYGIPGPGAAFDAQVRAEMRSGLKTLDPKIAEGLCHIVRLQPAIVPFFASRSADYRANVFVKARQATLGDIADPKVEQRKLAESTGMIATFVGSQQAAPPSRLPGR